MANTNLSQKNYTDYVASKYFKALGVSNTKFTPKTVKYGDEEVVLFNISGVQDSTGIIVNVDLWPRNHATEEEVKAVPKRVDDIYFRIGYWAENDENGEKTFREGVPKWIAYVSGGKEIVLSGDKREFGE
jgi:hypothetical protein